MSWLFGGTQSKLDIIRADAWLRHKNAADHVINDMYDTVNWSLKRKLEAKKKLTKKEQEQLKWIKFQVANATTMSEFHENMSHRYGDKLGLF